MNIIYYSLSWLFSRIKFMHCLTDLIIHFGYIIVTQFIIPDYFILLFYFLFQNFYFTIQIYYLFL